jgi:deoxyribodipyrimidine photo-lyase
MPSPSQYKNGLFLFHRDLRMEDNVGLHAALSKCDQVYTIFIFTPEQVGKTNPYKSNHSVQFMIESLAELRESLKKHSGGNLILLYGHTNTVLDSLISHLEIDAVFFNRDYTPYAVKRDAEVEGLCKRRSIACETAMDYYLHEPGSVVNKQGKSYHKFTPYYEAALRLPVEMPKTIGLNRFAKTTPSSIKQVSFEQILSKKDNHQIAVHGGRTLGMERLKRALLEQRNYVEDRNHFTKETTMLSAYLKYGCISVREVFHAIRKAFGAQHEIIRQLIWRDFFAQLLYLYPDTLGHSYYPHFEKIRWKTNARWLQLWKDGQTGFPIVDACMRQLNTTGYMHNRGRMVVANFLVKTLLLDWREGERYFAQKLVDYDVASNLGNWSAIVGGGAYSMPYFRVMNPWIQSATFDKDTIYIKKWVPELKDVKPRDIHRWNDTYDAYRNINYPHPLVDYEEQKEKVLELYKKYV